MRESNGQGAAVRIAAWLRRWRSTAVALCVLFTGGCASTHVGNDWQCPMVRGVPCQKVSQADPARAGGPGGRQNSSGRESVVGPQGSGMGPDAAEDREASAERAQRCVGGCRPFGRLRRILSGRAGTDDGAAAEPEPVVAAATPTQADDLRTPELVGRIWIAPYVDAHGVYREGAWVRAVLRPARWVRP